MARLFLALPLPSRLQDRLGQEIDRLRLSGARVGWVPPRNLHLTLRFLGEVDERELLVLDPLFRHGAARSSPMELVAAGLGAFPDLRRPRVVWCGVRGLTEADGAALRRLQQDLEGELEGHGFRPEKGHFHPHVTLGRLRSPANAQALVELIQEAARQELGGFRATEIVLCESRLRSSGSEYTALQTVTLGG